MNAEKASKIVDISKRKMKLRSMVWRLTTITADNAIANAKKYILKLNGPISINLPPPPKNISSSIIINMALNEKGYGTLMDEIVIFMRTIRFLVHPTFYFYNHCILSISF